MANVLLLEPNRVLSQAYTSALQHAGHQVSSVHSAQEAIHAADQTMPDVVLLELQLAGHDGIEFLHEFRSYPEWQAVPVVVISNMTPSTLQSIGITLKRDLGVTVCLYKPRVSLDRLLKTVNEQVATA
jgi:DNA-binding response OmpR family regulator